MTGFASALEQPSTALTTAQGRTKLVSPDVSHVHILFWKRLLLVVRCKIIIKLPPILSCCFVCVALLKKYES
jgi:hypothetical protein